MSSSKTFTVAVIGGGFGGVALTLGLVDRGVNVQLYEKLAEFGEVGSGLSFPANSVLAMKLCSPAVYDVFDRVASRPTFGGKEGVFFEMLNGQVSSLAQDGFVIPWDGVSATGSRGTFLDGMTKHLPPGVAHLSKQLLTIEDDAEGGPCTLNFADGTTAKADVVVGFDGIGSHVRHHLVGKDSPATRARYSHEYCYRIVVPMEKAIEAVGEVRAKTPTHYLGHGGRVVTIPMSGGKMLTIGAHHKDPGAWPSEHKLTLTAHKPDVLAEFTNFAPEIQKMLSHAHEDIDRWGLYDLAENAPPLYARGRVCIAGDGAHATTPHMGVGAGFAMEDAALLAELLGDEQLRNGERKHIEAALQAYQTVRMPRGHWLPVASRECGNLMSFMVEGVGDDVARVHEHVMRRTRLAWEADIIDFVREAKKEMTKMLSHEDKAESS